MKNDSGPVQSGPRFNISWTFNGISGFSFSGGSNNFTKSASCNANWTRHRLDLQNPGQTFPIVPIGAVLQSVVLIVDEPGTYTLDNINFRDQIAAKPGSSSTFSGCP